MRRRKREGKTQQTRHHKNDSIVKEKRHEWQTETNLQPKQS